MYELPKNTEFLPVKVEGKTGDAVRSVHQEPQKVTFAIEKTQTRADLVTATVVHFLRAV